MKYCQQCGSQLMDNSNFCPYCGSKCEAPVSTQQDNTNNILNTFNQQQPNVNHFNNYNPNTPKPTEDQDSVAGYVCLSLCFPIVGIILFCVWNTTRPKNAKAVLIASIISIALTVLFYVLMFIIGLATADYETPEY